MSYDDFRKKIQIVLMDNHKTDKVMDVIDEYFGLVIEEVITELIDKVKKK